MGQNWRPMPDDQFPCRKQLRRRCRSCRFEYAGADEIAAGFTMRTRARVPELHRDCNRCRQDARDARKQANRWVQKARWTRQRHAKRYKLPVAEFARRYGWEIARIAHDFEHAYANTCPYCWEPYAAMVNGLSDMTLDVVRANEPPDYRTNVQPCCGTCNTEKGKTLAHLWSIKCDVNRRRAQWLANGGGAYDTWVQLCLFVSKS